MLRKGIVILAVLLFIAGPAAKIYHLKYDEYYLVLSALGLISLTILFFKQDSE